MTFDPRVIPNRNPPRPPDDVGNFVFGRQDGETLAELQQYVSKRAADLAQDRNADDDERVRACLPRLDFARDRPHGQHHRGRRGGQ